ncbi:hypothetical protein Ddye_021307 [Dipteronia dyeriana]|uniref:Trichome birefringence-like N-terminal domain-containing protein n=1 Tax=Dipteronia dyeriana TaxID=168575 RepID=A0AAD9WXK9_9ROSI|nr:hypothetical protein Ddye_021307 [Dipteronia dyeriana]
MANVNRNRYTVTALLFLIFFLLSIFLFTKRTLEPSLSFYTDFSQNSHIASPVSVTLLDPDPVHSPTSDQPESPISGTEFFESNVTEVNTNGENETFVELGGNYVGLLPVHSPTSDQPESPISGTGFVESNVTEANTNGEHETFVELGDNNVGLPVERVNACDLYAGYWVKDVEHPIYEPGSCPYVDEAFDCQSNGRQDSSYLNWRWKPDGCDLPRFNASDFLERLRGKRLMLVGDSMNRNQFESLLCLLHEGLANKSKMYETRGRKITKGRGQYVFKFQDYDCTVEFVRSHFLVKEGFRINERGNQNPTLSIDRIDRTAGRWKRADILVFNTGHWWVHGKTARGKNYYKEGDYLYPKFDAVEAYRRALKTWAKWIDDNIKPNKQLVFYRGYSNAHFRGGDWDSGGSCNGETEPILTGAFLDSYPLKMKIVEEVIQEMQTSAILLNVTKLTNFRKDGHPSVYGKKAIDGRKVSTRRQDCSHWCLPGVPDAWNELIYATLVFRQTISGKN